MRSRPFHEADLWSVAVYLARSKYMVIPEGWETCHYFSRFCFPTNSVDNCLLPHILLLLVKPCKPCRGRCIERTEAPLDPLFTWPMRCAWRFHTFTIFIWGVEPELMGLIETNLPQWACLFRTCSVFCRICIICNDRQATKKMIAWKSVRLAVQKRRMTVKTREKRENEKWPKLPEKSRKSRKNRKNHEIKAAKTTKAKITKNAKNTKIAKNTKNAK